MIACLAPGCPRVRIREILGVPRPRPGPIAIAEGAARLAAISRVAESAHEAGIGFVEGDHLQFLDGLAALRKDRGMTTVLIAHSKIERFENPEVETYDRYAPRLHKHAAAVIQEWCDEVLFATYEVHTKVTDEGFNKTRAQGVGTGRRIVRTTERPAHVAKNRLNLPEELPLDWTVYAEYLPKLTKS